VNFRENRPCGFITPSRYTGRKRSPRENDTLRIGREKGKWLPISEGAEQRPGLELILKAVRNRGEESRGKKIIIFL